MTKLTHERSRFNMDRREQIEIRAGKTLDEFFFRPDPARQLETLLTRLADSNSMIKYIETCVLPREEVKIDRYADFFSL